MSRNCRRSRFPGAGALVATLAVLVPVSARAAMPDGPLGTVMIEVSGDEGTLEITQAFTLVGGKAGTWTAPLLLPEGGPLPRMVEKVGDAPGIDVQSQGGASVSVRDGAVILSGTPGMSGGFGVQVHWEVPVTGSRLVLAATPTVPLSRVEVIHRGGPYALQVRPLAPFGFREESEADGTWRYQDLLETVPAGQPVRVAVGRLPTGTGPYRAAGLGVLLAVAAGTAVLLVRRRRG